MFTPANVFTIVTGVKKFLMAVGTGNDSAANIESAQGGLFEIPPERSPCYPGQKQLTY
jgi:hypothetical protein